MRGKIAWMLRVVREVRFAALVAGAIIAGFGGGSAAEAEPVQLRDIAQAGGGFAITGESLGDDSGRTIASAGDVNGDGLDDLIVGAWRADPNGNFSGRSYVVFGKATGATVRLGNVSSGIGGFAIDGEVAGDASGWSVSAAGDFNGDGLADLLVGTRSAGRSYIVFGRTTCTGIQLSDIADGRGGIAIERVFSVSSLSAAGDVNGDGLADVIIGSSFSAPNGRNSGRSYIVFGTTLTTLVQLSDIASGIGGFAIDGPGQYSNSGSSVSAAGDVNGDGLADVIIGTYNGSTRQNQKPGASYVVFGKASGTRVQLSNLFDGGEGFSITGGSVLSFSGFSVSGAGDVNGDGLSDLIVGGESAYYDNNTNCYLGRSYVVFGKTSPTGVQISDITAGVGGFMIDAEECSDHAGESVSGAGDINGDGLSDLIVGASRADPNGFSSGRCYVIFGRTSQTPVQLSDVAAGSGGFSIDGSEAAERLGVVVSEAGDVNGDGLADIAVGSGGSYDVNSVRGRSYVIFSAETSPRSAVYNAFSRAGDGPGGNPVVPTVVGESRVTIDWPDDDFGSSDFTFASSKERVVLNRSNSPIRNFEPMTNVAQVCWGVLTNRADAGPAEITFKYLNYEIADIALASETDLAIFAAEDFIGPWIKLPTTIDPARNTARVTVPLAVFKHFALAEASTSPVPPGSSAEHFEMYK